MSSLGFLSCCVVCLQRLPDFADALCAPREGKVYAWGSGALGLTPPQLTELHAADATSQVGSAGNYEWAYGESLLNRQAHLPQLVDLS